MTSLELKPVETLPSGEDIQKNVIYLLETGTENVYEQFVYSNSGWKSLGLTSVDLSNFYTKQEIDDIVAELKSTSQHTHSNKEILDMITAAFTIEEKALLKNLSNLSAAEIVNHMTNKNIHLSADQVALLEAIVDMDIDAVKAHLQNTTIHMTQEKLAELEGMLDAAKAYTDEKTADGITLKMVGSLPSDLEENIIYFVPSANPTENHIYEKYMYIGGAIEAFGGGSSGESVPSDVVTIPYLESYFSSHSHTHSNKYILDLITAAFTTELKNSYDSSISQLMSHAGDTTIHLSSDQIDAIEKMATIELTIRAICGEMISSAENPGMKIIYADALPTNLSNVDKTALYFIRKNPLPEDSEPLAEDADITDVAKAFNYDKYFWSDEYKCWETFGDDLSLTDEELNEILS